MESAEKNNWMGCPADLEVAIVFLPTEHGGRKGSAFSGYRPQFYYDGADWDALQSYPDQSEVRPGEAARAYLYFLSPEPHEGRLWPGKPFLIREGQRTVGYGVVRRVLNSRLQGVA